ncbi:hypothetical protein [Nostoc sp. CCY0012]|uniref:hypothetical protein n=1 Tax=Nostoc sp. CCY0012 TaxID=1056123 RepID=UPI0039C654BD
MTNYCNPGDTARVTLADGRVFEYTQNLPINIECNLRTDECARVRVYYTAIRSFPDGSNVVVTNSSLLANTPIGGARINPSNNKETQLLSKGHSVTCAAYEWRLITAISVFTSSVWQSIVITRIDSGYRLIIKDSLNNELFNELVNTCGYDVECIENCPPNSLDCGDCCLSCDSVFNEISSIRALVKGLK